MILFYSENCDGDVAVLENGEAIHCRTALRKKVGDEIFVTDGKGHSYRGEITKLGKKTVEVALNETIFTSPVRAYRIHIAIAPTKNISRFEWFIEKASELGIDEITPLLCSRSERKVIKLDRLNKILISAMKQSLKSVLPKLNEMTKFEDFIRKESQGQCFIANLEEDPQLLIQQYKAKNDGVILIGPEGDFTPDEIAAAHGEGFDSVSLGDYRLRTETAGISAVQAIHFINQFKNK